MTKGTAILLAENDAEDQRSTVRALRSHGIGNDIVIASTCAEATALLFAEAGAQERSTPQIALVTFELRDGTALELLRRLRAEEPTNDLPVGVRAATDAEEAAVQAARFEHTGCLRKPLDFGRFVSAARRLGLFWYLGHDGLQSP